MQRLSVTQNEAPATENVLLSSSKDLPCLAELSDFAIFEDNLSEERHLLVFDGLVETLSINTPEDLDSGWGRIKTRGSDAGLWAVLTVHYEMGLALEPKLRSRLTDNSPLLQACLFSRRTIVPKEKLDIFWDKQLNALDLQDREAGVLGLKPSRDENQHSKAVDEILDLIAKGDCYQVNLTMPFFGSHYGHPVALYARLRKRQPVRYAALIRSQENWILSRSPELFVEKHGDVITCRPMKGTAKRDKTIEQDLKIAQALSSSEKNRAENLMIVDLIRNDLGRIAPPGEVRTEALFELETYETLHQLTSTIKASRITNSPAEILSSLFPCGSITGAPKIRAMEIISELEQRPRGIYCGALGWINPEEDFRFSVPIRTLLLGPGKTCRMDVGSGIVADSKPDEEYQECLLKARFATGLQDDVQLMETMRWQPTLGFPMLALHMARLTKSARALDYVCDTGTIIQALHLETRNLPHVTQRIRLKLWRDGSYTINTAPLEPLEQEQTACIAPVKRDPKDPRLFHKTSARALYDETIRLCATRGHFDSLFFNIRGELCEGARSNVFLEKNGRLLTPGLDSGLLPGVLRASLLESTKAQEATLNMQDLMAADRIWLGNALRGLILVKLPELPLPSQQ